MNRVRTTIRVPPPPPTDTMSTGWDKSEKLHIGDFVPGENESRARHTTINIIVANLTTVFDFIFFFPNRPTLTTTVVYFFTTTIGKKILARVQTVLRRVFYTNLLLPLLLSSRAACRTINHTITHQIILL